MVDTINPNKNNNQEPVDGGSNQSTSHSFYSGFGRPDDVKVNLAKENSEKAPVGSNPIKNEPYPVSPAYPESPAQPAEALMAETPIIPPANVVEGPKKPAPKISDLQSKPEKTYQTAFVPQETKEPFNWRGPLLVVVIGIVVSAILGGVAYYVSYSTNQSAIKKQTTELSKLNNNLNTLLENPTPLELAVIETPPTVEPTPETPVVETPEPVVEEPQIQEPTPVQTPVQPGGGQEASG